MPFCSNCGSEYQEGIKFCSSCGNNLGGNPAARPPAEPTSASQQGEESIVWEGKPSGVKGMALEKAKANPTTYVLTNHRLILKTGLFGKKEDQIDLFRVKDIRIAQGITERAMGIGHIEVISTDSSSPKFVLDGVKDPNVVKELIWNTVKKAKGGRGVLYME